MNERLTVYVPTYNRLEFLRECIQSILDQTFKDFKIVVLDNASDQDVAGLVSSFNDPRISLIRNQVNIGSVGNIQKALDIASTEFVTVFHDDDYMHPRLLETQIKIFDEVPGLVFVATPCTLVYDSSKMRVFSDAPGYDYEVFKESSSLIKALITRPFGFAGVMYRTCVTKRVKLDVNRFSIACDRPFLVSLAEKGPCAYLKEPTYNARQHTRQDSASLASDEDLAIEVFRFYREKLDSSGDHATKKCFNYMVTSQLLTSYVKDVLNHQLSISALLSGSLTKGVICPMSFVWYSTLIILAFITRRLKGGVP